MIKRFLLNFKIVSLLACDNFGLLCRYVSISELISGDIIRKYPNDKLVLEKSTNQKVDTITNVYNILDFVGNKDVSTVSTSCILTPCITGGINWCFFCSAKNVTIYGIHFMPLLCVCHDVNRSVSQTILQNQY